MKRIKFEINEPGPIAIKVVDVMGITKSRFLQSYESAGQFEFDYDDRSLPSGASYYYKIYDAKGLNVNDIEGLNGGKRLLLSGNLNLLTNGNGKT